MDHMNQGDIASSLILSENSFGPDGAQFIANGLKNDPHVRRISLSRNGLKDDGRYHHIDECTLAQYKSQKIWRLVTMALLKLEKMQSNVYMMTMEHLMGSS